MQKWRLCPKQNRTSNTKWVLKSLRNISDKLPKNMCNIKSLLQTMGGKATHFRVCEWIVRPYSGRKDSIGRMWRIRREGINQAWSRSFQAHSIGILEGADVELQIVSREKIFHSQISFRPLLSEWITCVLPKWVISSLVGLLHWYLRLWLRNALVIVESCRLAWIVAADRSEYRVTPENFSDILCCFLAAAIIFSLVW